MHAILLLAAALAAPPAQPRWPLAAESLIAADAASYAPPDLKAQLAKHRDRYMAGVKDAAAAETGARDARAHRAAAARGARAVAEGIRKHQPFADAVYELGGVVHEIAAALPPGTAPDAALLKSSSFGGFPAEPFRDPEALAGATLSAATARQAYDASVTLATRLFAWTWKRAGGDASIATQYPETRAPYPVRGDQ
jgi:hypothetical protein